MKAKDARMMWKVMKLVDMTSGQCLADENWFARGLDGEKWVSWIMMIPGCQIITDKGPIDQLAEAELDRLLAMRWLTAKPINALEALARYDVGIS